MFPMFINRAGINKNVININNGEMAERIENIIHDVLEFTRGILKTKRHHIPLIVTQRSGKSSFIPIILFWPVIVLLCSPLSFCVVRTFDTPLLCLLLTIVDTTRDVK